MYAHRYTNKYRPPDRFTLPEVPWELVERPAPGLGYDRRTDLPASAHRFGVVAFANPLTPEQVRAFELQAVP